MKRKPTIYKAGYSILFFCLFLLFGNPGHTQGRVLINEYLPWPNNACGTTAEFIELLNFGPGPVNIGCYIVTDGDYSITIPANTILQPGQFYVLAGQSTIPQNCGNDLRTITVNLNWTTCGCTSGAIPVTGDGFLTDGGSGSEQIVLLDPSLKVVDAVVRDLPVESSSAITTATMGGSCTARSFDLDTMNIIYETIGESTGRGNSMAREIDGGCRWIKDTQESAGDPNNTGSSSFSLDATLTIINAQTCSNTGSVSVSIAGANLAQLFPIQYLLAKDVDSNNIYNFADNYITGADSTAPAIPFSGLSAGKYQVVLGSAKGCDLTPVNFIILNCNNVILSSTFTYFRTVNITENSIRLEWNTGERVQGTAFEVERSYDGISFNRIAGIADIRDANHSSGFYYTDQPSSAIAFYRIRMISASKTIAYSTVQKAVLPDINTLPKISPNPFTTNFLLTITTKQAGLAEMRLTDNVGKTIWKDSRMLQRGENSLPYTMHTLPGGIYYLHTRLNHSSCVSAVKLIKML